MIKVDFGVDESEITASLKVAIALMIEAILVARPSGKSRTMCGATHYPINVLVNYGKRNASFAKTLRKPKTVLPALRDSTTNKRVRVVLDQHVNGKSHTVNGRINKDMIIIKVFK